jgi:hypothetical protein
VIAINRRLKPLSKSRHAVLLPVVAAYPSGLSEDELKDASAHEGAVTIFKGIRVLDRATRSKVAKLVITCCRFSG